MLLPVDMREWLPPDHLAWFVLEAVDALDTTGLERTRRRGGVGAAGYDPRMLFGLLVYAYCRGVRSSRQIERMCTTDVAFRVLCAQDVPDHVTIARFRAEAQAAFSDLFSQVLMIAARAGLGRFGTVAIDGTKIRANASIDANRGLEWFDQHVAGIVADADRIDRAEDAAASENPDDARPDRSRLTCGTAPVGGSGSDRQPTSWRLSSGGGPARMRNVRLLRWSGGAARSRVSRWWVAFPMDRTALPRHRHTWPARSSFTRPNSTDMQP